ncbi:hypothetical protein M0812_13111 [Anaeramoeba flamelloides]|uniref:Tyrosine-protein kinase ephrin type A/B receptor-like domain-containing protein n=1 Tax=Anaeramoeba flamelloides TaxID=1746091 RepID=A0AAV7ZGF8_9EUKA|nr:hypothetical protein M0812_13111 [Anaeramoeba flamelloides]
MTIYICGSCGKQNNVKPTDPIRCRSCGYRILYKKRTKRIIQFEAQHSTHQTNYKLTKHQKLEYSQEKQHYFPFEDTFLKRPQKTKESKHNNEVNNNKDYFNAFHSKNKNQKEKQKQKQNENESENENENEKEKDHKNQIIPNRVQDFLLHNSNNCSLGSYLNSDNECQNCSPGTFCDLPDATSSENCLNCPIGKYSQSGASVCLDCPVGTFGNVEHLSKCFDCMPGSWSNIPGNVDPSCNPCPAGTYSTTFGATTISTCIECEPGTYNTLAGATAKGFCLNCPVGTYNPDSGSTSTQSCNQCPLGSVANATGSSSCYFCEKGKSPSKRKDLCESCHAGTYASHRGSEECVECPINTINIGATNDNCVKCIVGGICLGGDKCKEGHDPNQFCQVCTDGKFRIADICVNCQMFLIPIVISLLIPILLLVIYFLIIPKLFPRIQKEKLKKQHEIHSISTIEFSNNPNEKIIPLSLTKEIINSNESENEIQIDNTQMKKNTNNGNGNENENQKENENENENENDNENENKKDLKNENDNQEIFSIEIKELKNSNLKQKEIENYNDNNNNNNNKLRKEKTPYFQIIFYQLQFLSLILILPIGGNRYFQFLGRNLTSLLILDLGVIIPPECTSWFSFLKFWVFISIIVPMSVFILVSLPLLLTIICKKIKNKYTKYFLIAYFSKINLEALKIRIIRLMVVYFQFMFIPFSLINSYLANFDYNKKTDHYYLQSNPKIEMSSNQWKSFHPFFILFGIINLLFAFICYLIILYKTYKSNFSKWWTIRFGLLFNNYLPKHIWFGIIEYIFSFLIAIIYAGFPLIKPSIILTSAIIILIINIILILIIRPYKKINPNPNLNENENEKDNGMENINKEKNKTKKENEKNYSQNQKNNKKYVILKIVISFKIICIALLIYLSELEVMNYFITILYCTATVLFFQGIHPFFEKNKKKNIISKADNNNSLNGSNSLEYLENNISPLDDEIFSILENKKINKKNNTNTLFNFDFDNDTKLNVDEMENIRNQLSYQDPQRLYYFLKQKNHVQKREIWELRDQFDRYVQEMRYLKEEIRNNSQINSTKNQQKQINITNRQQWNFLSDNSDQSDDDDDDDDDDDEYLVDNDGFISNNSDLDEKTSFSSD